MSTANSATITNADPGYSGDKSAVTKNTTNKGASDNVTVDADEDGVDSTTKNAVIVLTVNADGKATATVDDKGNVDLNATGSGTIQYLQVEINSSDNMNWTVYVNTSGGSTYNFVKGNGGGGHK